jgi:polynucleotide 5'-kinase involved in rRNA processing
LEKESRTPNENVGRSEVVSTLSEAWNRYIKNKNIFAFVFKDITNQFNLAEYSFSQ